MNYLSVDSLSISFGERTLFQDVSFGLAQGEKRAIVGVNGCGKSTLLRILAGKEKADQGGYTFRNDIKVSYLPQIPEFLEEDNAYQAIFYSEHQDLQILREYERLTVKQELTGEEQEQIQDLLIKMDELNLWDYESQIKQILGKLGITNLEQKLGDMSGGQRKRVAMARELIARPDFLMLDEPTNHLDIDMIEWLEDYLSTSTMTVLMITHDRYFLDKIATGIIEIEDQRIYHYPGKYDQFLERKAEREELEQMEVDKARNLMRKELEWIRRQPKARGTKARYRVNAFEETKKTATRNLQKSQMDLDVSERRLGGKILELTGISKAYGDLRILKNFSYIFKKGEKIGIVGNNGSGKSTFLNIITGLEHSDEGTVEKGTNTQFGYYRQWELKAGPDEKVLDRVKSVAEFFQTSDGKQISASQFLNKFLFPPKKQHDYIYKLSGGEKRRLQLLLVLIKNPNFLILDEPTNDLDIVSLNVLEEFLMQFSGCLMVVTHDRYFMDKLVDHLFIFEGEAQIVNYNGNYSDYRQWKKEQVAAPPKPETQEVTKSREKPTEQPRLSYKEKREIEKLQDEIEDLEKRKEELEGRFAAGEGDATDFETWGKELSDIREALDEKEMRWLELSEKM